jgi:hypothetical protein
VQWQTAIRIKSNVSASAPIKFWLNEGQPESRDKDDWREAQRQIDSEDANKANNRAAANRWTLRRPKLELPTS